MSTMKLGEILERRFGYPKAVIEEALRIQSGEPSRRLGDIICELHARLEMEAPAVAQDVAVALTLQDRVARERVISEFDITEYEELGRVLWQDQTLWNRRLQHYAAALTFLILYAAYPLSQLLQRTTPDLAAWSGCVILYALIGIFLSLFAMVMGDHMVKFYGQHLKRRLRLAKARADLRHVARAAGAARTSMADRRHRKGERPDPDLTGFQQRLPVFYAIWSLLKIAFIVHFVACIAAMGVQVDTGRLVLAALVVAPFVPIHFHFLGGMCERYHQYVREGQAITPELPFPGCSRSKDRNTRAQTRVMATCLRLAAALLWAFVFWTGISEIIDRFANVQDGLGAATFIASSGGRVAAVSVVLALMLVLEILKTRIRVLETQVGPIETRDETFA